jgi:EmrB/QacA subfamily drug resistance transporter
MTGYNARLAMVGIPTITHDIGTDIWGMTWIIQGYMLGSSFIQLIVGRLSDLYGRVKLFNLGIAIFTLGAFLSGISLSPIMLIISRIIQGIGGAFLMSLSVTILTDNIPPNRLGRWLGINQISWRVGAVVGLTLSGFIIDYLGWRWIFLTQIPIGILTLYWSLRVLREKYSPKEIIKIDWLGFGLFTASITLLLIALTLLGYGYAEYFRELLIASIIILGIFVYTELRASNPALDLRIFRVWRFTGGIIAQLLYSIGFGASLTLLSIYLQSIEKYSASETGLLLVPFEIIYLISGVLGGYLSDLVGYEPITIAGLLISSTGLFMFSRISDVRSILLGEVVFGLGTGLFVSPNTSSIMTSVPPHRRGVASSLRTISFNIGFLASLNIAVLTMTQHIPYQIASRIITLSYVSSPQTNVDIIELEAGIRKSFLLQAVIMLVAVLFSITRIEKKYK